MNDHLFSFSIPVNVSLIAGKNLRQTINRDMDTEERIILSCASILKKITVYEILFIMGLKVSMKHYVESFLEQLYNDGYLDLEDIFDKKVLQNNLDQIFQELYESKDPNTGLMKDSQVIATSNNILHFSSNEIKEEINKIRDETSFLYQYSLNKEGKKALKEKKIKTYSEEAIINFALINFNSLVSNTGLSSIENTPTILNDPNSIISIIINKQNFPQNKSFISLKKSQYNLIAAVLKDQENNLIDPTFSIESIELSKTTEFIEQNLKNQNMEFFLDKNGNIVNMNIKGNDLEKW